MFRIRIPAKLTRSKSKSKKSRNAGSAHETAEMAPDTMLGDNGSSTKSDFKPFTKESTEKFDNKSVKIARECGYLRKRKSNLEDESVLPGKYEPFPSKLYGHPLEEIDNFIYEEDFMKKRKVNLQRMKIH